MKITLSKKAGKSLNRLLNLVLRIQEAKEDDKSLADVTFTSDDIANFKEIKEKTINELKV